MRAVQEPGYYRVLWDGTEEGGKDAGSGVYLYRLATEEDEQTRRLVLVR